MDQGLVGQSSGCVGRDEWLPQCQGSSRTRESAGQQPGPGFCWGFCAGVLPGLSPQSSHCPARIRLCGQVGAKRCWKRKTKGCLGGGGCQGGKAPPRERGPSPQAPGWPPAALGLLRGTLAVLSLASSGRVQEWRGDGTGEPRRPQEAQWHPAQPGGAVPVPRGQLQTEMSLPFPSRSAK